MRPLLETVVDMTDASAERAELDPRVLMMVRLGALAAVGAPAASYLSNLAAASDARPTFEEARSALIAVAPIVGTPKVGFAPRRRQLTPLPVGSPWSVSDPADRRPPSDSTRKPEP